MDIIYLTILISIIIIILNFVYISVIIFDLFIRIPFISIKPIFISPELRMNITNFKSFMLRIANPILLLFIILYIICYIFYILIKTLVPDTGLPTFFIPLKELLLKIPPLPSLEQFGVFRLFECIIEAFKIKDSLQGYIKTNMCFFDFSRDNIKTILRFIFGSLDINLGDNEEPVKKIEKKEENVNIVHKNINEEINICYKNNRIPLKIGMSAIEKSKIDYLNNQEYIKCRANSIGKYIRTNN